MAHPLIRLAGLTVAAVLTVSGLAACTRGDDNQTSNPTSNSAAENPVPNQPTDISSIGQSADPQQVGADVRAAMEALKSYRIEMVSSNIMAGQTMESSTSLLIDRSDPALVKVKSTSITAGEEIVMIQIGNEVYTKLPGSTTYTRSTTDANQIPNAGGADQLFTQAQQVRFIGDESLDGTDVRHYLLLDTGATIDVFVNDQDRVLKTITTTQPAGGQPGATEGKSTVEITWHDFDQPQDIAVPDPSEVQG